MSARKYESASNQLEEEKNKLAQLKQRFEDFKVKSQQEKEKTARLAQSRQEALEKDWKEKMNNAEQDVKNGVHTHIHKNNVHALCTLCEISC